MAQTVQNVTLSLTLPISCQICLGKVRKPVICCNHHVFCSACIEIWLQKCSQCPTCRVAITPENPCREIIGATNESHVSQSGSVRKHLRRTRVELLMQEYEDEVENLQRENDELRNKNLKLETELKEALRPGPAPVPQTETPEPLDCSVLKETENKLRAAGELYLTVSQDLDKLRDANKTLRSQNVDLIQENVRLRAEVESRSPQKFGRYTVAALEAKIAQYEREMKQLKKALERSDQYIEELEEQASRNQMNPKTQTENPAVTNSSSDLENRESLTEKNESGTFAVPSTPPTPSSALRGLNLNSPVAPGEKKPAFNRLSYLRRLNFDDCGSTSSFTAPPSSEQSSSKTDTRGPSDQTAPPDQTEKVSWRGAEEARMDAAFLDKVSELDFMMAEGEGSRCRTGKVLGTAPTLQSDLTGSESPGEERDGGAEAAESSGETVKRKCPIGLVMSSPSKVSKIK
ncbi:ORC ubiquitin ligase 1 [Trichomycterus rosablanca]|uniref:ORC ubiquitin ligase 1 n=1 Tax=Trichomycterus rosablanca TaxID=2290929 RepID=UPI002F350A28